MKNTIVLELFYFNVNIVKRIEKSEIDDDTMVLETLQGFHTKKSFIPNSFFREKIRR